MDASFHVNCLEDALRMFGTPEIFNTDQESQFTSGAFTDVLKREEIAISMDGRGRAFDNIFVERLWRSVKHEDVYLNGYASMGESLVGLRKYFAFYNEERPYQSLGYRTPEAVYKDSKGGGAMIVDKYPRPAKAAAACIALRSTKGKFDADGTGSLNTNTSTENRDSAVQLGVKLSAT